MDTVRRTAYQPNARSEGEARWKFEDEHPEARIIRIDPTRLGGYRITYDVLDNVSIEGTTARTSDDR